LCNGQQAHIRRKEKQRINGVDYNRSHAQSDEYSQGKARKAWKKEGPKRAKGCICIINESRTMHRMMRTGDKNVHSHEMRKVKEREERAMGG